MTALQAVGRVVSWFAATTTPPTGNRNLRPKPGLDFQNNLKKVFDPCSGPFFGGNLA